MTLPYVDVNRIGLIGVCGGGISPRTLDLRRYDTVYLGSPIWLYSPAPPVWAFVENNRLDGKHVVLFNTYNSEFKSEFIESLKAQVVAQGMVSFEHKAVRRGRMTQQIAPEIMLREIDAHWPIVGAPPLHAIKVAPPR